MHTELRKDVIDMRLDGRIAYNEFRCNLCIAVPLRAFLQPLTQAYQRSCGAGYVVSVPVAPANPLRCLNAIQQGHADIHQDHIRVLALRDLRRDQPTDLRFAHDRLPF
jgi:hypothetical protein